MLPPGSLEPEGMNDGHADRLWVGFESPDAAFF
jgi:hypothetical protein